MKRMIYTIGLPDGSQVEVEGPEGATQDQIRAAVSQLRPQQPNNTRRGGEMALQDSGVIERGLIGAGKAVSDIGTGIKQLGAQAGQAVGLVSPDTVARIQRDVDETKQRDQAVMNDTAGLIGNVVGNVAIAALPGASLQAVGKARNIGGMTAAGRALLSSPASLQGALTQGAYGATLAGLGPVGSDESRGVNALVGGAAGAAVPVAGMALKGGRAMIEPLYQGGRERVVGRALRNVVGENVDTVTQRMANARPLVPGSQPTAAEVSGSGGVAAFQRAASAMDPEAYAERAMQNNVARFNALSGVAPDTQVARTARDKGSKGLYDAAKQVIVNGDSSLETLLKRPSMSKAWARAQQLAAEQGDEIFLKATGGKEVAQLGADGIPRIVQMPGEKSEYSVKGLHYLKMAMDDLLDSPATSGIGKNEAKAIQGTKGQLLNWLETKVPEYGQARTTYAQMSKPVNQAQIRDELLNRVTTGATDPNGMPTVFAQRMNTAMKDPDLLAQKATGFGGARYNQIMTPQQAATIRNVQNDLRRVQNAQGLGKGPGSDTVQKLAMSNIMDQSGLPMGILNWPGVGRFGQLVYSGQDDAMRAILAQTLLDPQATAQAMRFAAPSRAGMLSGLAARSALPPLLIGGAMATQPQ
jgi:hypothetical protein